jgi:hypothetical protein
MLWVNVLFDESSGEKFVLYNPRVVYDRAYNEAKLTISHNFNMDFQISSSGEVSSVLLEMRHADIQIPASCVHYMQNTYNQSSKI